MMNPLRSLGILLGLASATPELKISDDMAGFGAITRGPKTPKQRRARAKAKRAKAARKAQRRAR